MSGRRWPVFTAAAAIAVAAPGRALAAPEGAPPRLDPGAACVAPGPLRAEETRPAADELFERGKRFRDANKIPEACACFEASNRALPGRGGTVLSLGLCHEQEGKLVAAWRDLQEALTKARQDGRADREAMAGDHLIALEAKLSWLDVAPPPNADARQITLSVDGAAIESSGWRAIPVLEGQHVVAVAAPGFRARELAITVAATERRALPLDPLDPLDPGGHGVAAFGGDTSRRDGRGTLRTAALVTGIAGVALSLATGIWALERKGVVGDHCPTKSECDGDGLDAASTGRALVVVSTAAFAVGAVGFGAWIFVPREPRGGEPVQAGLTVRGTF